MPPVVPERSSVLSTYDEDRNREKLVDFFVNVQAKAFDKAASYNNIVVSLGFAGFFTLWAWSQPVIHPWDSSLLALILGFSLFLFVFWNIITTFLFSRHNIKMAKALSQNTDAQSKIRAAQSVERDFQGWSLKYYASWYIVFLLSAISGFISGLMLLFLLGMNIIYESFSLHSVIF